MRIYKQSRVNLLSFARLYIKTLWWKPYAFRYYWRMFDDFWNIITIIQIIQRLYNDVLGVFSHKCYLNVQFKFLLNLISWKIIIACTWCYFSTWIKWRTTPIRRKYYLIHVEYMKATKHELHRKCIKLQNKFQINYRNQSHHPKSKILIARSIIVLIWCKFYFCFQNISTKIDIH